MSETKALATYLVNSRLEDIPEDVRHESRRALLNYIGCAVGGSHEPAVETALKALEPYFGKPTAGLLARPERMDPLLCRTDQRHQFARVRVRRHDAQELHSSDAARRVGHFCSCQCASRDSGRDFIHAFLLGFETEARVGNAVYPAHYDAGWHITSTAGVFGAAAAIGKLLGLSIQQMIWALGMAATQASGLREMFGYMAKSFHAGRAAQNGYAGAVMAQSDFTAGDTEHRRATRVCGGAGGEVRPVEDYGWAGDRLPDSLQRV